MGAIVRVLGKSGSGKTTLITKIIKAMPEYKIGVIKHTRHKLNICNNQKDTRIHFNSGALVVAGISLNETEIFLKDDCIFSIEELISIFLPKLDLLMIEGAREYEFPTVLIGETPENAKVENVILTLSVHPELDTSLISTLKKLICNQN